MFPITSIRIIYRAGEKWNADGGMALGAAFAFYALFAIGPLLLIAIHLTGAIFGEDAAQGEVFKRLQTLMGDDVARNVEVMVKTAAQPQDTFWTPTVSFLFLIFGSLGAFLHARTALCLIWKLEPPHKNGWLAMLWDYVLAVIMVFIVAVTLLISLACGLVVPILQKTIEGQHFDDERFWHWFEIGTSYVFLTLLFAMCYRILSGNRISWGYVWYGSLIAAVLFTLGKTVLSYYLVYSGTESFYGAAGSVVVFLIWVYYSSQVLFFGAELIQARRTRHEWLGEAPG